jgi:hypothetical protein
MNKNSSALAVESKLATHSFIVLIIASISGGLHWLWPGLSTYTQINLLGHITFGILVCILLPVYCYIHFKRIIGSRKPLVNVSGIAACLILFIYLGSSIVILLNGHSETNKLLFKLHKWGAVTIIFSISAHLIAFRFIQYKKNKINKFTTFIIQDENSSFKKPSVIIMIYLSTMVLIALILSITQQPSGYIEKPENYDMSYGEHPFRPSQTETEQAQFIALGSIANSHTCTECHQDISKQWLSSTHRLAAADPTYVTNISLLAKNKGIAATRYCEGCHAPVALLTGELTPGGLHGGIANTPANHEGVGCVSCHRATKEVHLDGVASYHFEPQRPYLFDNSDNTLLTGLNHLLINLHTRPHQEDMDQAFTKEPASCATCHTQFMDKEMNDWGWVRMQDEYRDWLASPFAKQGDPTFGNKNMQRCQDCHMPLVKSNDPSANEDGMIMSHRFVGANTMLPHINGDKQQFQETVKYLQNNKLRITIEEPNRQDAIQSSLNIKESLRQHSQTPFYFYLNENAEFNVSVANIGVGHNFPGGSTDINQAWVAFVAKDAMGSVIYESGQIEDDDILDPDAHIYQSIPIDRQGNHVWKHDLFNMIGQTYKNIIKAGKTDLVTYKFNIPPWAKGPLTITATLRYRKLNTRYAKWALKELYTALPIVDMARDTLNVDVFMVPAALGVNNNPK